MTGTGIPPLYDEEAGLAEIARARLRRDGLTRAQVQLADGLALNMERHFSAEEVETAGRALLIAAASAAALVNSPDIPPACIVNILGFTAARMVTDGRAWLDAQDVTP